MINLNFSGLKIYKNLPMTVPVSFKLSPSAKEKINEKATLLGVNMSEYMRTVSITDGIFINLNPSGSIAQGIIEAHSSITCLIREKKCNANTYPALISKLNGTFSAMEKIYDELPVQDAEATFDTADPTIATSSELKSSSIQFYVSSHLKEYIDARADSLEMDTAQFLRIAALAEQPVYVLEKGHYISRYLIEMYDLINEALINKDLDGKYDKVIQRKVEDIFTLFVKISLQLTNVNLIEGASDTEE